MKFLTFVTKTRGIASESAIAAPETCGVSRACWTSYFFPPTSHPVAALKWGPSAECLRVCLPNPHEDLSLCHKFTESTNQMEHILR